MPSSPLHPGTLLRLQTRGPCAQARPSGRLGRGRRLTLLSALLLSAPLSLAQTAPVTPPAQSAPVQPVSVQPVSVQPSSVQSGRGQGLPAPAAVTFTVQDALAALGASPAYRQLQLALQAAEVQAQAAQAATGLTAGVSGTAGYSAAGADGSGTSVPGVGSVSGSVSVSASFPLLPWAAVILGAQGAARSLSVAQVTAAQAVAALKTTLEQAYGRAVSAQLGLAIADSTLTLAQRQLAQLTAFQAQNNATAQSVQAAQSAVQSAQTSLQGARNELDSARRALGTLTGRDLGAASFSPDLSAALAQAALPDGPAALAAAQRFSPVLASARKAVSDAQAGVSAAERARRLPAATLTAGYGPVGGRGGLSGTLNLQSGVASASYTQPLGGSAGSSSFSLGLSASFNVLDPAADGALRAAQLGLQQAQQALVVQQASVTQSLQDSTAAAVLAAGSVLPRQTAVAASTTALSVARDRLAAGLATETDVLNAEIALAQAQRDLAGAQISALTTAAQLSTLTGLTGAP